MHRSKTANELLPVLLREHNPDIVLISKQYRHGEDRAGLFYEDVFGTAAIWIPDPGRFHVTEHDCGKGYARVKSAGVTYFSCYHTLNAKVADHQAVLDELEDAIGTAAGNKIVAGDFDAKSVDWGETESDNRGDALMDMVARQGLAVLNTGTMSTFRRTGHRDTIVDVSFSSENLVPKIKDCQVLEEENASDHQYIRFDLNTAGPAANEMTSSKQGPRWNTNKMDREIFNHALEEGTRKLATIPSDVIPIERARLRVDITMRAIRHACEIAIPKKGQRRGKRPLYWWTEEISILRRECLKLRRTLHKARRKNRTTEEQILTYVQKKKELRLSIKKSKQTCWRALADDLNRDPWGLGYKIVTQKIGGFSKHPHMDEETLEKVVNGLFPTHMKRRGDSTNR